MWSIFFTLPLHHVVMASFCFCLIFWLSTSKSNISPLLNNFYIRFFACVRGTKALYFHTKIIFLAFFKMKKIDFENFKVIFDNVRINGFLKFLSTLIRSLFNYNLKKPHRNSLEGVRERLKTLMLQTKLIALYITRFI